MRFCGRRRFARRKCSESLCARFLSNPLAARHLILAAASAVAGSIHDRSPTSANDREFRMISFRARGHRWAMSFSPNQRRTAREVAVATALALRFPAKVEDPLVLRYVASILRRARATKP